MEIIEELEEIKDDFIINPIYEGKHETGVFMILTIEALKDIRDYARGLCEIQKTIIIDQDKLEKRIRNLEGAIAAIHRRVPTKEEVKNIKIGLTD